MKHSMRVIFRCMIFVPAVVSLLLSGCTSSAASSAAGSSASSAADGGSAASPEQSSAASSTADGSSASSTADAGSDASSKDGGFSASDGLISAAQIQALPDCGWQFSVSFPDWKGKPDNSLAMNSMVSFEGRHGQGTLYAAPDAGITSFSMYINNIPVDTTAMEAGKVYEIDFSGAAVDGLNTIQVTDILPAASGQKVGIYITYPTVLDGTLEEAGISQQSVDLISDLIESDIENGFTSAQLAVIRHGRLVYQNAWGSLNSYNPDGTPIPQDQRTAVTTDTMYDIASITKMFGTNYALQKLVTDGELNLDAKVSDYLGPSFYENVIEIEYTDGENPSLDVQKEWKRSLTIRDLLRHQGGFPADPRYFNPHLNTEKQEFDPTGTNKLFAGSGGDDETREATIEAIGRTPLMYEPGTKTVYSDVDYMVLGIVIEQVTGKDLDTLLKETFLDPMGLTRMTYTPLDHGFTAQDCAATELCGNTRDGVVDFPGIRKETLQGTVHDEKAYYSMGGVSGHAGLFSNASDLARLASVMLTGGYGEHRFFSRNVIDMFTAPKKEDAANWGLGWWREGDDQRDWYFGTQACSGAIGHQGWTGTLIMVDPSRDLVIAYLTNKLNTPLTDNQADPNNFRGSWYTASTLGFVPQILSIGMDSDRDVSRQLLSLVFSMTEDSLSLIPEGASADHPSVKSVESLISLYNSMGEKANDPQYEEKAALLKEQLDSHIR